MVLNFSSYSISEYLEQLSRREPIPGGGSAAALTAAMGVGLLSMVTQYSIGRKANTAAVEKRLKASLVQTEAMRRRLLQLATLDSKAYLGVSKAKSKDIKTQKAATKQARLVPAEVCQLCYKALQLAPFLVDRGNPYLLSDVEVAVELLFAGFNGAKVMVRINS